MVTETMPYDPTKRMLIGSYWYAPGDQTLYFSYGAGGDRDRANLAYGVYLVRETISVPEPSTLWLSVLGLLVILGSRYSNRIKAN